MVARHQFLREIQMVQINDRSVVKHPKLRSELINFDDETGLRWTENWQLWTVYLKVEGFNYNCTLNSLGKYAHGMGGVLSYGRWAKWINQYLLAPKPQSPCPLSGLCLLHLLWPFLGL